MNLVRFFPELAFGGAGAAQTDSPLQNPLSPQLFRFFLVRALQSVVRLFEIEPDALHIGVEQEKVHPICAVGRRDGRPTEIPAVGSSTLITSAPRQANSTVHDGLARLPLHSLAKHSGAVASHPGGNLCGHFLPGEAGITPLDSYAAPRP
jgi:hypothetical protein